jgi:ADP-ribose pyrophosphatase YjhB (NUDIX family)
MVGSSILPVTIHKKRLYFLFGKENSLADTPGWSDFGGGVEAGESVHATAMREGGEELTGFLGDGKEIADHIQKHGGTYDLNYNDQYHIHMFYMPYDETLPKHYNRNHRFLWKRMNKRFLNNTKLFEKAEIRWFSENEIRARKSEFRRFYQDILDRVLFEMPQIEKFMRTKMRSTRRRANRFNRTRKNKK